MGLIRFWMLRAHGKSAEAAFSQDAANGAFGNLNVKALLDLRLQIAAAPAHHAGVWLRLHNPVQLRKLLLIEQGLAPGVWMILKAFNSLGIVPMNSVWRSMPALLAAWVRLAPSRIEAMARTRRALLGSDTWQALRLSSAAANSVRVI
jgi:hypothetical protein